MSPHQGKFIAYFRVSTDKQGKSGLGLQAQRKAVLDYLDGGRWSLVQEFVEIESGKHNERPQLAAALAACKKHKARLVIAKLDRLSRNLAFIATLMESGVEFVAVDNPHATKLTVHILAAVAEHEREMISERTRAALRAAKARGTRLGNPTAGQGCQARHGRSEGECEAVRGQCAADYRGDRAGRHHQSQCHCRKAQRAQRANGARWQMDSRSGRRGAAPFRGKRGRPVGRAAVGLGAAPTA
jgi:DNA invertase Pin-like site-specific DNA recombinase